MPKSNKKLQAIYLAINNIYAELQNKDISCLELKDLERLNRTLEHVVKDVNDLSEELNYASKKDE